MESATGEAFVTVMTAPAGNFGRQSLPGNMESTSAVNEVLRVIGRNPRALRITSSGTTSSASSRPVIRGGSMVRNSVIPYGRTANLATTLHLRVGPERLTHNAPPPRRPRSPTLQGERKAAPEPAHRHFGAVPTNMLWSADVTEIETGGGRLYLATVFDLLPRCLLGYGTAPQRRPGQCFAHEGPGSQGRARGRLDPHSDRGSEDSSAAWTVGRIGSVLDDAGAEASTPDQGRVHAPAPLHPRTPKPVFCNTSPRRSSTSCLPPVAFYLIVSKARAEAHQKARAA